MQTHKASRCWPLLMVLAVLTVGLLGCSTTGSYTGSASAAPPMAAMTTMAPTPDSRTALMQGMRKLWADHVVWTRLYIIAAVGDQPDAQPAAERLLKNQEQIGQAIVPYYGPEAGGALAQLLKEHILIAVDLVQAAKAHNQASVQDADRRWHANAADIATFLSGANPHWPRDSVLAMMNEHLALTTREAMDRLNRNWSDDVVTFDSIFNQAMMMADTLSNGIVAQFPNQFHI